MFFEIRSKYQNHGKTLAEKAAEWLKEGQVGRINQVVTQVQELGTTFEE